MSCLEKLWTVHHLGKDKSTQSEDNSADIPAIKNESAEPGDDAEEYSPDREHDQDIVIAVV